VYNMDDDNLVYETLCRELRKVTRFSVFPVGNLGPDDIERPIVRDGKILGWRCGWTERKFPVDMGGFAFPARLLFDLPSPIWPHAGIGGESEFISRFVESADGIDVSLCHYNKMCLVYHNEPLDSPVMVG
jgi:Glycosyltransferase family 43